jgi:hypothetical protein
MGDNSQPVRVGKPQSGECPSFTQTHKVRHLDADNKALPEEHRDRYVFLDSIRPSASAQ